MVSFGLIYGFFRVHLGFHVGVSYQEILSGFLEGFFGFHLGSLGFHLGYKQERIKQKKRTKNKEAVKTGSREAAKQEVGQQKHMTEEKKK